MRADGERRALLLSILDDPGASHSDRLRADELLADLELHEARSGGSEHLSPEQVREEFASLALAVPGMLAVAAGVDAVEPPVEVDELREVIDLQERLIAALESRLAERERALQRVSVQRLLPAAPELALA